MINSLRSGKFRLLMRHAAVIIVGMIIMCAVANYSYNANTKQMALKNARSAAFIEKELTNRKNVLDSLSRYSLLSDETTSDSRRQEILDNILRIYGYDELYLCDENGDAVTNSAVDNISHEAFFKQAISDKGGIFPIKRDSNLYFMICVPVYLSGRFKWMLISRKQIPGLLTEHSAETTQILFAADGQPLAATHAGIDSVVKKRNVIGLDPGVEQLRNAIINNETENVFIILEKAKYVATGRIPSCNLVLATYIPLMQMFTSWYMSDWLLYIAIVVIVVEDIRKANKCYDLSNIAQAEQLKTDAAIDAAKIMSLTLSTAGKILNCNRNFYEKTGFTFADIKFNNLSTMLEPRMWDEINRKISLYVTGEVNSRMEFSLITKQSKRLHGLWNITNYSADLDQVDFMGIDITDIKEFQEKIQRLAYYDTLTGLANRSHFKEKAYEILGQDRKCAMFFIDLDNFKRINDTYGHLLGDKFIYEAAQRLTGVTGDGCIVARFGGDEMNVLIPDYETYKDVVRLAASVLDALSVSYEIDDITINSSASIGVALYPQDAEDVDNLMKNADIAMYKAKENGKAQYVFYTPLLNVSTVEGVEGGEGK